MSRVKVSHKGEYFIVEAESGSTLLDAVRKANGIHLNASCGGKGTCGKCKLKVLKGGLPEPAEGEIKFLGSSELKKGYRLSCMIEVTEDMEVLVESELSQILTSHKGFSGELDPVIRKKYLTLPAPSLEDQRDDAARLKGYFPDKAMSLSLMRKLPAILKESAYSVTVVYSSNAIFSVEKGDTRSLNYGIAVDIGTTTIAAYLLDNNTGKIMDSLSGLNNQKNFGADVISRIEFSMQKKENLKVLTEKIVSQIGDMSLLLAERNGISKENIYSIVLAGNTTMLHIVFGIDPEGIASAPFIPGFLGPLSVDSLKIGHFPINCTVFSLPSISGYVGADIVAGILATGMHKRDELSLLIDIGTNGEIVLGNSEKLYCCSTAAGPAFEGAQITCGLGGVSGAVDSVRINGSLLKYTTIRSEKATGICGSGIIDLMAALLESGLVNFTGRIQKEEELENEESLSLLRKIGTDRNGSAFVVVKASETDTGEEVVFTQKDIREVQLAKAAISAGIATLLSRAGRDLNEVGNVFIAGGFGSYISKKSAASIGLIPAELLDRTESVGNTAGLGALTCSFSEGSLTECDKIIDLTEYVELSSDSFFQTKYMEDMVFPEP